MIKYLWLLLLPLISYSQRQTFDQQLFATYEEYKEVSLETRRIKHQDIQPLIDSLSTKSNIDITLLGESIQGRSIQMISLGEGEINVLLWSQMHGDESTATMALFDILHYLQKNKTVLKNLRIHMIPMLNPDGAEIFSRRNAIGIDINRDALRLQSPESVALKKARDSLNADFGFNLHDQSKYYNAKNTNKPATISFLAPAYNVEKDINQTRGDAMRIIAHMNKILQRYAKGQIGRYSDEFEPRAFGDNMQKWGTSTILIESGGHLEDPEKQFIRKLNYVGILSAIQSISGKSYESSTLDQYLSIPRNDRKLYDLKIEHLKFSHLGIDFEVDLGINHYEIENKDHSQFYYVGKIIDVGDLSTHYGYNTLDAKGYEYKAGETYPKILDDFESFKSLDFASLLKQGYTSVSINDMPSEIKFTPMPMNIIDVKRIKIPKSNSIPDSPINLGADATFLLKKDETVVIAVVNGFVYYLNENKNGIKNGVVK